MVTTKEQIKTLIKEYVDDALSEWCTENSQILEPWHQLVEDLSFIAVKAIQKISEHYNFVEKTKLNNGQRWRAENGEIYYQFDCLFNVDGEVEMSSTFDNESYEIGNYFRTEDEAKQAAEVLKKCLEDFNTKNIEK